MKNRALLAVVALTLVAPVFAQDAKPAFQSAPPPPGMNDPGVKPSAQPVAPPATLPPEASRATPAETSATVLPGKPIPLPAAPGEHDAQGEPPPTVNVYKRGEDTVQEFRRSGQLYMVTVTSAAGISQTYMADSSGKLHGADAPTHVQPVMYKVAEWGAAKKQGDDDSDASAPALAPVPSAAPAPAGH